MSLASLLLALCVGARGQACDSVRADSAVGGGRLVWPLVYDGDIVHRAFAVGGRLSWLERGLLARYVMMPEVVDGTAEGLRSRYGGPALGRKRRRARDAAEGREGGFVEAPADFVEQGPKVAAPDGAPVGMVILRPNFWALHGAYALQFMQHYVSGNWHKGGESHFSALGQVTLEATFNNKQRVKWENRLELKFGLASTRSDSLHSHKTTDDLIRLTSKLGLQATKRWYYTLQVLASTQFAHGYKSNDATLYSDFLAPGSVNVSVGMDYSADWLGHRLKGSFHLAPLAYNMKYTRRLGLSERLGIGAGRHFLHDFGSELTIDLTWQLMEAVAWHTRLYGYTAYDRSELEWENTLTLRVNRFVSAQLFFFPRFDDGVARGAHHGYWQLKEYASVGFALEI